MNSACDSMHGSARDLRASCTDSVYVCHRTNGRILYAHALKEFSECITLKSRHPRGLIIQFTFLDRNGFYARATTVPSRMNGRATHNTKMQQANAFKQQSLRAFRSLLARWVGVQLNESRISRQPCSLACSHWIAA